VILHFAGAQGFHIIVGAGDRGLPVNCNLYAEDAEYVREAVMLHRIEYLTPGRSGVSETSLHRLMNSGSRAGGSGRRRSLTQLFPSSADAIVLFLRVDAANSRENCRQSGLSFIQFERQKIAVQPSPIVTFVAE
jgi:hypothetical protein